MKKILRISHQGPQCLLSLKEKQYTDFALLSPEHLWRKVDTRRKSSIWKDLNQAQNAKCAYCENSISQENRHIDHFYPKDQHKDLVFEWTNLFGSCDAQDNCGHYKKNYIPNNVIKPDEEDGKDFFKYTVSGEILPKDRLCDERQQKAKDTISFFNLNNGILQNLRERKYLNYKSLCEQFLKNASSEKKKEFLKKHIKSYKNEEFGEYMQYLVHMDFLKLK